MARVHDITLEIQNEIVTIPQEAGMNELGTKEISELLECADTISNEDLLMLLEKPADAQQIENSAQSENERILTRNYMSKAFSLIETAM